MVSSNGCRGRPVSALVVAAVVASLVGACGGEQGALEQPNREADVEGEVRSVTPARDGGVVALIVPPGDACGVATAVDAEDRILVETADGLAEADVAALADARAARAWLDTPVAESCPAQAGASDIVISSSAASTP